MSILAELWRLVCGVSRGRRHVQTAEPTPQQPTIPPGCWLSYCVSPPPQDRIIEIVRHDGSQPIQVFAKELHPETNIHGLYWRPIGWVYAQNITKHLQAIPDGMPIVQDYSNYVCDGFPNKQQTLLSLGQVDISNRQQLSGPVVSEPQPAPDAIQRADMGRETV